VLPFLIKNIITETNDLIYEGIATISPFNNIFCLEEETNDLIYEGIATHWRGGIRILVFPKQTT